MILGLNFEYIQELGKIKSIEKLCVWIVEVLIAARAMHAGMSVLRPKLVETGVKKYWQGSNRYNKGRFTRYWKKFS